MTQAGLHRIPDSGAGFHLAGAGARLTVPGPPAMRVLGPRGNVWRYLRDPLGSLTLLERRYGGIASLCSEGKTRLVSSARECPGSVFVFDPELHRQVLRDEESFQKSGLGSGLVRGEPTERERAMLAFGEGLFTLNGADHRRHRRLLTPAFSRAKLNGYRNSMVELTERFLAEHPAGSTLELRAAITRLTFQIASQCLFGQDPERSANALSPLIAEALSLLVKPLVWLAPYDVRGLPYRKLLEISCHGRAALLSLIAQRRASSASYGDVLDALLRVRDDDGSGLTDEQIVSHMAVLFIAGHETSANALLWTLFLLSQHPRVARDLYDEVSGMLRGDAPGPEQLEKLPLLDHVIKESMRILPPVPTNHRIVAQPVELAAHLLPSETEIFIGIYNLHRRPELFAEPTRFLPERWQRIDPAPHEYAPFGGGSRICIGAGFARFELKILLATIVQRVFAEVAADGRVDSAVRVVLAPRRFVAELYDVRRVGIPRVPRRASGSVMKLVDVPAASS